MSLYIEEMTLPHEDVEPMHLELYADGTVFFMKAPDDCYEFKAVLVPPHGDLIDRKTAYNSLLDGMVMTGYQSRALDCISDFYVPTIIPAEEGET